VDGFKAHNLTIVERHITVHFGSSGARFSSTITNVGRRPESGPWRVLENRWCRKLPVGAVPGALVA